MDRETIDILIKDYENAESRLFFETLINRDHDGRTDRQGEKNIIQNSPDKEYKKMPFIPSKAIRTQGSSKEKDIRDSERPDPFES